MRAKEPFWVAEKSNCGPQACSQAASSRLMLQMSPDPPQRAMERAKCYEWTMACVYVMKVCSRRAVGSVVPQLRK